MKILIAVTGGIAAYKIPSVVSVLVDKGHFVKVMMTKAAEQFITPLTFSALSHNPVYGEHNRFMPDGHIHHIELADWADIIVVAPATYNTISKIEQNLADNLVTSTIAAFTKKVLIFPAMNTHMWENGCFNSTIFKETNSTRQIAMIPPAEGKMACGTVGPGKLLGVREIIKVIETVSTIDGIKEYFKERKKED